MEGEGLLVPSRSLRIFPGKIFRGVELNLRGASLVSRLSCVFVYVKELNSLSQGGAKPLSGGGQIAPLAPLKKPT